MAIPAVPLLSQLWTNSLKEMNVARGNFLLLLSNAAGYMIKAAQSLQVMYPRLLRVTCAAHMLRSCAEYRRAHNKATDNVQ